MEGENVCAICGSAEVVEGHAVPLCSDCREKHLNYPIPNWIKVVAILLICIVGFALVKFPSSLRAGVAYERGIKAETGKRYITASEEFKKASEIFPNSTIINARLFVAYGMSDKPEDAYKTYKLIAGKESSDDDLLSQVNDTIHMLDAEYALSDGLSAIVNNQNNESAEAVLSKLTDYTNKNPSDAAGYMWLGNTLFDMGKYDKAKSAYLKALEINPDFYLARLNTAAVYRETGEFDKAIQECNEVLENNSESTEAYVSLTKIELKRHDYKKALEYALKSYGYDKSNLYVINNLAIAYHYNNMIKERDEMYKILEDNNYYDLKQTKAIFDGKNKNYE